MELGAVMEFLMKCGIIACGFVFFELNLVGHCRVIIKVCKMVNICQLSD